jgi:ubiquinone/menaquinone biosynthesis C-methylase UbiE
VAKSTDSKKTHELVRKAYGDVAKKQSSCCSGPSCCGSAAKNLTEGDLGLSCGDPVTFSCLKTGDVVLDLGSGAGKDVFLAARKVGAEGRVIGVDMTKEMLALAHRNAEKFKASTGLANVEFREGQIEALPTEDASVDIVISNCVINLSPDKPQVFREAYRSLKPGGRLVVSDIVLDRPLPENLKDDANLYTACIAGALPRKDYLKAVGDAGFQDVRILTEKGHEPGQAQNDPITSAAATSLEGVAVSITVFAAKPK